MPCLLTLLGFFLPRFALVVLWLGTDRLSRAFDSWPAPVLGFIFLPFTTLIYALVAVPGESISFYGWIALALALVMDSSRWAQDAVSARSGQSEKSQDAQTVAAASAVIDGEYAPVEDRPS